MSAQDIDESHWAQLWSYMSKKFGSNFQLQIPFSSYNWKDPPPGYIDYRSYDLFNQMPSYSRDGMFSVNATGIYDAYGVVIIETPKFEATPSQKQQLQDVQKKLRDAVDAKNKNQLESYDKFGDARKRASASGKTLVYSQWIVEYGWVKTFDKDAELVNQLALKMANIIAQYPDNKKAVEAYCPPNQLPTAAKSSVNFMKCDIDDRQFWKAAFEAPTPCKVLHYLSTSEKAQMLTVSLASHVPLSRFPIPPHIISWARVHEQTPATWSIQPFFRKYVGTQWQRLSSDSVKELNDIKLSIQLKKIDKFTIQPGGWYNSSYLADLAKKNSWNDSYTFDTVFGKSGILPSINTHFVAVLGITVVIEGARPCLLEELKTAAHSGIQIGPFKFGGDSGILLVWDSLPRPIRMADSPSSHMADSLSMHLTSANPCRMCTDGNQTIYIHTPDSVPFIVGYLVSSAVATGSEE